MEAARGGLSEPVMPAFVPRIPSSNDNGKKDVDGQVKRAFAPVFDGPCPAMTMTEDGAVH